MRTGREYRRLKSAIRNAIGTATTVSWNGWRSLCRGRHCRRLKPVLVEQDRLTDEGYWQAGDADALEPSAERGCFGEIVERADDEPLLDRFGLIRQQGTKTEQ